MFPDLSHDQIVAIGIMFAYAVGAISAFCAIVTAVVIHDTRHPMNTVSYEKTPNVMELNTDLDHIDQAIANS